MGVTAWLMVDVLLGLLLAFALVALIVIAAAAVMALIVVRLAGVPLSYAAPARPGAPAEVPEPRVSDETGIPDATLRAGGLQDAQEAPRRAAMASEGSPAPTSAPAASCAFCARIRAAFAKLKNAKAANDDRF